ncbi:MAG: S8 family serine peptidase, partial [bacterium]
QGYYDGAGTSFATPLVGGAAALLLEAHPDWTPMQVREALMMTASRADHPDNLYGWGIIDVLAAIEYGSTDTKGDINGDGIIDIIDALMVVDFILSLRTPFPEQLWAADCNDDGAINVLDVVCIVLIILGNG